MNGWEKTIVFGRLAKDPVTRDVGSTTVCTLDIPVDKSWGRGDDKQTKTTWYRVSVWGANGENCQRMLHKGSIVMVEGTAEARAWAGDDGTPRAALELRAHRVQFISDYGQGRGDENTRQQRSNRRAQNNTQANQSSTSEDIPF